MCVWGSGWISGRCSGSHVESKTEGFGLYWRGSYCLYGGANGIDEDMAMLEACQAFLESGMRLRRALDSVKEARKQHSRENV